MVTVKELKPYFISVNPNSILIALDHRHFSVLINDELYHFAPLEAKEIHINRKSRKVENLGARFAFQKGGDIIYIAMTKLVSLPDFLHQLYSIVEKYFIEDNIQEDFEVVHATDFFDVSLSEESTDFIKQLEEQNLRRLIDKALDERDEETFRKLANYFNK